MTALDPSTFVLRPATTAEKLACWRANSASWAGKLSVADYLLREAASGSATLTRDGGVRYWVFVGPSSGDGSGEEGEEVIYASAESVRKLVVVRTREGGLSHEWSHAIQSVFTPEKWRRRGIAGCMMRRLGEWLDGEEAGCRFSVLYSDVGEYYSRLGWPLFPSIETSLPPTAPASAPSDTTPLTVAALPALCERDVSAVTSFVCTAPLTPGTHTRLAFLPTYAQVEWHFAAEDLTASKLFTSPPRSPTTKGAISASGKTWGYWVHDYNDDKLTFLRLVSLYPPLPAPEEEEAVLEISAILRAAQAEAASWAFKKVVLWNPNPRTLAACKLVLGNGMEPEVRTRTEGSIPCLRWKGGEREVEKGVEWAELEKYSWC